MEGRRCATAATQQRQRSKAKFLNPNHASRNSATLPKHIHSYIHIHNIIHADAHAFLQTCIHRSTYMCPSPYIHPLNDTQTCMHANIHPIHPIHPSACIHSIHPASLEHTLQGLFFLLSWPIFTTKTKI
jgi:hypothetical protein